MAVVYPSCWVLLLEVDVLHSSTVAHVPDDWGPLFFIPVETKMMAPGGDTKIMVLSGLELYLKQGSVLGLYSEEVPGQSTLTAAWPEHVWERPQWASGFGLSPCWHLALSDSVVSSSLEPMGFSLTDLGAGLLVLLTDLRFQCLHLSFPLTSLMNLWSSFSVPHFHTMRRGYSLMFNTKYSLGLGGPLQGIFPAWRRDVWNDGMLSTYPDKVCGCDCSQG